MVAYEFYYFDNGGNSHLLGVLPERRKSSMRITKESVMQWGELIIGHSSNINQLYFVQVDM